MESFLGSQWLGWLLRTLVRLCQPIVDTAHSLPTIILKRVVHSNVLLNNASRTSLDISPQLYETLAHSLTYFFFASAHTR